MMREVHLGGQLGKKYGRRHRFDINTPAEALRALEANHPGFLAEVQSLGSEGYGYRVLHGSGFRRGVEEITGLVEPISGPVRIQPEIMGAKKGGIGQIIAAVVLVAAAVYTGGLAVAGSSFLGMSGATLTTFSTALMGAGISMGIGGVMQLLSPVQKASDPKEKQDNPSYVFDGPVNTMAQGHPVPVGYGEMIVGSAVISAGIEVEEIPIAPNPANKPTYEDPNSGGELTEYPAPTLFWDNNTNRYRLPNGENLQHDEVWSGGHFNSESDYSAGTLVRSNFRTSDGRVPYLNTDLPEPRYDIPNPTSFASYRKSGSSFVWYVLGSVEIAYVAANQRFETTQWTPGPGEVWA